MPALGPIKRSDLVKYLRKYGFDGPSSFPPLPTFLTLPTLYTILTIYFFLDIKNAKN